MRAAATMIAVLACASAVAQPAPSTVRPRLANGVVVDRSASAGLARTFRELSASVTDAAWVGYAVPIVDGEHQMCCDYSTNGDCCSGCRLEPGSKVSPPAPRPISAPIVQLEPPDKLFILFRIERGQTERIRVFSEHCSLDAGGRTIHWLTDVRPADSVALLAGYATGSATRRVADGALSAVAMHADPSALEWLLDAARTGGTTHIRGQALFWLSQRAGHRAVGAIANAIEQDPDTEVKRRAVFALSQLPPDDGVPRLIAIARNHSNAAVRKQAFFWLGQSKDPRALAFFVSILSK